MMIEEMTKEDKIGLGRLVVGCAIFMAVTMASMMTAWTLQGVLLAVEKWQIYTMNAAPVIIMILAVWLRGHVEKKAQEWGVD